MPAKVKETILDPYRADAQEVRPDIGQLFFNRIARGNERAVEIGPLKALPLGSRLAYRRFGLSDQCLYRQRGDHNLRRIQRQRTAQGFGPFLRADALAHQPGQTLFGGAEGLGTVCPLENHFAGVGGGYVGKGTFEPFHREIAHLDEGHTLRIGDRYVEPGQALSRQPVDQPNMRADLGRQGRVKCDLTIRQGHPKMPRRIAGDQRHGPAGGDVHEAGVQHIARVQLPPRAFGQL